MPRMIFIFLCLTFAACKKDNVSYSYSDCSNKTNDIAKVKALIAGTYTWTHTYRYFYGPEGVISQDTLTLENLGITRKCVYDKNGTVSFIENNQSKGTFNYVIDYEYNASDVLTDSATVLILKDPQTGQQLSFSRPYLCDDTAKFKYISSISIVEDFFKRN